MSIAFRPLVRRLVTQTRSHSTQARPLTGFYLEILNNPLHAANPAPPSVRLAAENAAAAVKPAKPTNPANPTVTISPSPAATTDSEPKRELTAEERAAIIFGSPLTGPTEAKERHEASKRERGAMIAGIWVPPKPIEPDNCCMSGCVNCVLSQFVEDLDEWKACKRKAEAALKRQQEGLAAANSMDDDGGGSEGLWDGFEDIPVGLRVFMETEKRLNSAPKEATAETK
ncbi:oxidoreductase-like protein [Pyronema omphalodes]|nr:oxidoreductase-like protein [Pyronema omphalodes]